MDLQGKATQVADLFESYLSQPNNPAARGTLQDDQFYRLFNQILPPSQYGYSPNDIGMLQMNPQYRGLRMVLPQSGGSYAQSPMYDGALLQQQGFPRQMTQGPVGMADTLDPHRNGIPQYPPNSPPDLGALREMVYGMLIQRGYPVYGGTGDFGGDFSPGFNPIGFGSK